MTIRIDRGSWMVTIPLIGATVLYILVFFVPGQKTIRELCRQLEAKQQFIAQADNLVTALLATQRELEKVQTYNAAWDKNAPRTAEMSTFFGRINELAKQAGAATVRFSPEPPDRHAKICRIPLAMAVSGTFAQVHEFLRALDAVPARIWVESLRLAQAGQNKETINGEITAVVFTNNPEDSDYVNRAD